VARETGSYQRLGDLLYFTPYPLPPKDPALQFTSELIKLYGEATFALGQLNEMSERLPDPERFIRVYVMKEALLSSEIEGIHTTLVDVFTSPLGEYKPTKETQLVLNYTHALDVAIKMVVNDGLPIVSRVILSAHEALMSGGDGDRAAPGQFRKQSVRVGDLVPPLATKVPELISGLEKYMNEPSELPPLIQAGLTHVHFETIHPFLDGNGRIGRMLIVLMLLQSRILKKPILYPSFYFKKYHAEYYQRLDRVRTDGDFEGWIIYYLKAIRDSALDAYVRAKEIEELEINLKLAIKKEACFARSSETALEILHSLFQMPIFDISEISKATGRTYNTVNKIVGQFSALGLVAELKSNIRSKIFRFDSYLNLLEKEVQI
jgi:Fic family protein